MKTHFDTVTLTRDLDCAPDALWQLLTEADARAAWGAPDDQTVIEIDHCEVVPGGHEIARCGPKGDPHFNTRTDFHVVEAPTRLIGTEALTVGGETLSVAMVSQEVSAQGSGARLLVTLQIAALSDPATVEEYRGGWTGAMDNLERLVATRGR